MQFDPSGSLAQGGSPASRGTSPEKSELLATDTDTAQRSCLCLGERGRGAGAASAPGVRRGQEWPGSVRDQACFCDCVSDCMSGPCPFGEVHLQPPASALPTLNRTFIWDVKAHKSIGLELQFSIPRLRQIGPGESCPDGVTHSITGRIDATAVKIGTFCSNGTVSRIKMQEGVKMALHLPWFHNRNVSGFSIANRSSIKREHAPPSPGNLQAPPPALGQNRADVCTVV